MCKKERTHLTKYFEFKVGKYLVPIRILAYVEIGQRFFSFFQYFGSSIFGTKIQILGAFLNQNLPILAQKIT